MPGAGKSTVATILQQNGFSIITMGDVGTRGGETPEFRVD